VFPDKRGFITGLAVTGFGLGALITSPLATELIEIYGLQSALIALGTAYLAIVVVAAQFLRPAPPDYAPPGWTPVVQQTLRSRDDLTLSEALRTPHWYLLWSMLALNVAAGAALISVAAPLAQELTQVGPALGAVVVCLISLFNGLGRLFWVRPPTGWAALARSWPCSCCKPSPSRCWRQRIISQCCCCPSW
jgi:MFS transporter, OFA family, oxalate/formate antiporter